MVGLTKAEMVEMLEEIARQTSNRQAQMAAIKQLLEIAKQDGVEEVVGDDIDQLASRRNRQAA